MIVTLDTNALIRFFTNDNTHKAGLVEEILKSEKNILIPDVVFPELEYILSTNYNFSRNQLLDVFNALISRANLRINSTMRIAIHIFSKTKHDMADCIIAAYSLKGKLASFDKKLIQVEGIKKYWA